MLRLASHMEGLINPNIRHYVAQNLRLVLRNEGSTAPFGCVSVVHIIGKGVGEDLSGNPVVPHIKLFLNESALRRMHILGQIRPPLYHIYLGRKT